MINKKIPLVWFGHCCAIKYLPQDDYRLRIRTAKANVGMLEKIDQENGIGILLAKTYRFLFLSLASRIDISIRYKKPKCCFDSDTLEKHSLL